MPEIIEVMKEIGFENITAEGMINTAGRFMAIPKGAKMKKISLDFIRDTFQNRGYTIKE